MTLEITFTSTKEKDSIAICLMPSIILAKEKTKYARNYTFMLCFLIWGLTIEATTQNEK